MATSEPINAFHTNTVRTRSGTRLRVFAVPAALMLTVAWSFGFAAPAAASEREGAHEKPNHLSLILGGTHLFGEEYTAFTVGLDYERELREHLGVGVVVEHAVEEIDATSVYGVVDIHLAHGFVIQTGPGVEWIDDHTLAVGRFGVFYEAEAGGLIIAPSVSYDVSEAEDSLVFGLAIGTKF